VFLDGWYKAVREQKHYELRRCGGRASETGPAGSWQASGPAGRPGWKRLSRDQSRSRF
jgi:hypothetical protein